MKDVFKSLGIQVGGEQSLLKSGGQKVNAQKSDTETNVVRKGLAGNARDMLEGHIAKGGIEFKKQSISPYAEPEGERVENPSLKNTHGEEFHSDNDKQAEKLQSNAEVIDQDFDGEDKDPKRKAKKRGGYDYPNPGEGEGNKKYVLDMKSEANTDLFLKGISGKAAPRQEKDPEQVKEEKQQKKDLGVDKSFAELDSLIEMLPDPFNPRTIKNVHENSRGVIEKRRPSVFPELQRSMAYSKKAKKGKLVEWAKEEEEEHDMEEKSCSKKSELDDLADLVKGKKNFDYNKDGKLDEHEKDHKEEAKILDKVKKMPMAAKKSFIKSAGVGGMVFDFGAMTGNPIADGATRLLNMHADPVQAETANYQRSSYSEAIVEYTKKGEAFNGTKSPFGNIDSGWKDQLNKPMDQQVAEAFKAGELMEKGQPASKFGATKMNLGGSTIQAMSETDAAVIEMMKSSGMDMSGFDTGGTVVDATSGGKIKITAGE